MNKRKKNVIRFSAVFVTLVILALLLYGIANLATLNQDITNQISIYGTPALLVISFFLDLIPQMLSPIILLGTGILAGINTYNAILATAIGSALGSTLGFILGKRYMFEAVNILTTKKSINKLTYLTNKYGKIIVPIAAISPLPYLPVALGAINFSKRNFLFFGLIPRTIGIIGYGLLFNIF